MRRFRERRYDMATLDLSAVEAIIQASVPRVAPAAQLAVRWRGVPIHARAYGWLDPETRQQPTRLATLFDLASVTKLLDCCVLAADHRCSGR